MKEIVLYTKPCPINQKYGIINGRNLLTKRYRDAKRDLGLEILAGWQNETMLGDVTLNILQYFGDKRKRDVDGAIKIIMDAMEGIVYENDNQVTELHVYKEIDKENPRTVIQIL